MCHSRGQVTAIAASALFYDYSQAIADRHLTTVEAQTIREFHRTFNLIWQSIKIVNYVR